jgi:hypothetical protein
MHGSVLVLALVNLILADAMVCFSIAQGLWVAWRTARRTLTLRERDFGLRGTP